MPKQKVTFMWDAANTAKNWIKHKVRPFEIEEAFKDKNALVSRDELHSQREERYILLGKTKKNRFLYIAFTVRIGRIRVISGRDANRKEVLLYEEKISNTKI